ncbi:hypothetical protein V5G24_23020 [Xanthobacter sp. VTT E-85241]|uniref:hypothetical protein n=1 Tax=Roseixanthobacter finlandensis TaxID=3119922 RepID=UPI003729387C
MGILDLLTGQPQSGVLRYLNLPQSPEQQPQNGVIAPQTRSNPILESPTFANSLTRLGLNLMAASSQPGATTLGAIGTAGGATIQQLDQLRQQAIENQQRQQQLNAVTQEAQQNAQYGVQSKGFEGDLARAMQVLRDPSANERDKAIAQSVVDTASRLVPTFNSTTGSFVNTPKAVLPGAQPYQSPAGVAAAQGTPPQPSAAPLPAGQTLMPPPAGGQTPDAGVFSYQDTPKTRAAQAEAVTSGIAQVDTGTFGEIAAQTKKLSDLVPELQRVRTLAKNTKLGGTGAARLAFGKALGLSDNELSGMSEAETIQSIASRLAPAMRTPGSGSSSDTDVQMFLNSLPSLWNSQNGIDKIVDGYERILDRRKQEEKIARRLLRSDNSLESFYDETAKLGPVFKENELNVPAASASPASPAAPRVLKFNPTTGRVE